MPPPPDESGELEDPEDRKRTTTLVIAGGLAAAVIIIGVGAFLFSRSSGHSPDYVGLSTYLRSTDQSEYSSAELQRTIEDGGGFDCDVDSNQYFVAINMDKGEDPEESFAWLYYLCGSGHAVKVLHGMDSVLSVGERLAVAAKIDELEERA